MVTNKVGSAQQELGQQTSSLNGVDLKSESNESGEWRRLERKM